MTLEEMGKRAKAAARKLATAGKGKEEAKPCGSAGKRSWPPTLWTWKPGKSGA